LKVDIVFSVAYFFGNRYLKAVVFQIYWGGSAPMKRRKPGLRKLFAANLKAARESHGLSQEALAHDAGMHRTYLGSVERGERNISIDNIERLARALGVEPADLMR
jgi:ribosome-binding protein aMBF1 (putative translation factor)